MFELVMILLVVFLLSLVLANTQVQLFLFKHVEKKYFDVDAWFSSKNNHRDS